MVATSVTPAAPAPFPRHGPVGTEALLPFAEGAGGRMVHVSEVETGLRCGCLCPACGGTLIAKKGARVAAHFAHRADANCDARTAHETALHRLGKQLIAERRIVRLPPVVARGDGREERLWEGGVFRPDRVEEEVTMPGMRPDIVAYRGDRTLLVEIRVWHPCPPEKRALLRQRRLPTVEIDLSKALHILDRETLERAILHDAPREWVFNASAAGREGEWRREREARDAEQRRRAAAHLAAIRRAAVQPRSDDPGAVPDAAQYLAFVADSDLLHAIGRPIAGDGIFGVTPRLWQAVLLGRMLASPHRPVHPADEAGSEWIAGLLSISVRPVLWEEPDLRDAILEGLSGDFRHPRDVLGVYLRDLAAQVLVEQAYGPGWTLTFAADHRAQDSRRQAEARRQRVSELKKAYDQAERLLAASPGPFETWADCPLDGEARTPREVAHAGGQDFTELVWRIQRIGRLINPDAEPVEDGLLGFPVGALAARRLAENGARIVEERAREAARIARLEARARDEAAARYAKMTTEIRIALGDEAAAFVEEPRRCLGGRTFAAVDGHLSSDEYHALQDVISRRYEVRLGRLAAEAEVQRWREKLEEEAGRFLGDRAAVFLASPYPETGKTPPRRYCRDAATYEACLALMRRAKGKFR